MCKPVAASVSMSGGGPTLLFRDNCMMSSGISRATPITGHNAANCCCASGNNMLLPRTKWFGPRFDDELVYDLRSSSDSHGGRSADRR